MRYIPNLKRNFIALGTLDNHGCSFNSFNGHILVKWNSEIIMKRIMQNGLYFLLGSTVVGCVNVIKRENLARFSYKTWTSLSLISEAVLVIKGLASCNFVKTVYGKSARAKFKNAELDQGILDYVHSDLWGPSRVSYHGGSRYYMYIIDDYSRRLCVYVLKQKSDA